MKKNGIAVYIAGEAGVSNAAAESAVYAVFLVLADALAREDSVKSPGPGHFQLGTGWPIPGATRERAEPYHSGIQEACTQSGQTPLDAVYQGS